MLLLAIQDVLSAAISNAESPSAAVGGVGLRTAGAEAAGGASLSVWKEGFLPSPSRKC